MKKKFLLCVVSLMEILIAGGCYSSVPDSAPKARNLIQNPLFNSMIRDSSSSSIPHPLSVSIPKRPLSSSSLNQLPALVEFCLSSNSSSSSRPSSPFSVVPKNAKYSEPRTMTISASAGNVSTTPSWFYEVEVKPSEIAKLNNIIKDDYIIIYENRKVQTSFRGPGQGKSFIRPVRKHKCVAELIKKGESPFMPIRKYQYGGTYQSGTFSLKPVNEEAIYVDEITLKMLPAAIKNGTQIVLEDFEPAKKSGKFHFLSPDSSPFSVTPENAKEGEPRTVIISASDARYAFDPKSWSWFGVFPTAPLKPEAFKNVIKDGYVIAYKYDDKIKKRSLMRPVKRDSIGTFSLDPASYNTIRIDATTLKMFPAAMKKGATIIAKNVGKTLEDGVWVGNFEGWQILEPSSSSDTHSNLQLNADAPSSSTVTAPPILPPSTVTADTSSTPTVDELPPIDFNLPAVPTVDDDTPLVDFNLPAATTATAAAPTAYAHEILDPSFWSNAPTPASQIATVRADDVAVDAGTPSTTTANENHV